MIDSQCPARQDLESLLVNSRDIRSSDAMYPLKLMTDSGDMMDNPNTELLKDKELRLCFY